MKYFKFKNKVYAFELDGSQDHLITEEYVAMPDEDVDRHINPHKYMSDEEKRSLYLASLRPLKRRQFRLALVMNGYDLNEIEALIDQIEDPMQRTIAQIEWQDATDFERTNPTLLMMAQMLGLTSEQVDSLWEYGLTL